MGSKILYILQANENSENKTAFISKLANTDRDLLVLDYSFDGSSENRWSKEDLNKMRSQQENRKIVCYLSISEAEDYRYYWNKTWNKKNKKPTFLLDANKHWKGNYLVKYWDSEWQNIIKDYLVPVRILQNIIHQRYWHYLCFESL
jgi:cysteinyl-tRNA synthetase